MTQRWAVCVTAFVCRSRVVFGVWVTQVTQRLSTSDKRGWCLLWCAAQRVKYGPLRGASIGGRLPAAEQQEEHAGRGCSSCLCGVVVPRGQKAVACWLRVDAWKTNPDLGRYYESQSFAHVRTVDLPHRRSGALYQRPAGSVTGVGPRYLGLEAWRLDENGNPEWGWTSEA
jgi:hypothetical protein